MKAIDTNVMIYAHREGSGRHDEARRLLLDLAEGGVPWAIPIFCIGEFLRVVTHHRVFNPPTPLKEAVAVLDELLGSPSARVLLPDDRYWPVLSDVIIDGNAAGNMVFDAQIAALCIIHGVDTLISEDRDMRRFSGIAVRPIS